MENKNIILLKKRSKPYAEQCAIYDQYARIDVTSRNRDPQVARDLSPLLLGPALASDGKEAVTFENLWQYSKVYPRIYAYDPVTGVKRIVPGIGPDGEPTPEYWAWRSHFFAQGGKGNRHPALPSMIRHKDCRYMVYFENGVWHHLSYIEARKKIYIPGYATLVAKTGTYRALADRVSRGEKIALVDFDSWNYYGKDMTDPGTMKDAVNNPDRKLGHAYVIKMLLQGDIEVVNGTVVDKAGVLT